MRRRSPTESWKKSFSGLKYLNDVGLTYLTLDRLANSLVRWRITANQSFDIFLFLRSLVRSMYDEPSIGLHPRDNGKLISI
ncbi:MAG: hypothetical protein IPG02_15730 [Ignavibacteria bacterium]|nr:hypothetical protein [Ignavibacteria bacterium]